MLNIENLLDKIQNSMSQLDFSPGKNPLAQKFEQEIHNAHIYPLKAGGKRIRPLLTLLAAACLSSEKGLTTALNAALAVECLHTYTLVHDDLPCMDDDDLRRGLPTTHKVFGEAKALLVGDGLLAHSFYLISQTDWQNGKNYLKEILEILSQEASSKGVIFGQWLDISLTGLDATTWEIMEIVHSYKTGALLGASMEIGFLCGLSQVSKEYPSSLINSCRGQINKGGRMVGLAFQIIDDILDSTKSTTELGKTSGKDEAQQKYTAIKLLGEEKSIQLAESLTNSSLEIFKNVFLNFSDAQFSHENRSYEKLFFEQIKNLLARSN